MIASIAVAAFIGGVTSLAIAGVAEYIEYINTGEFDKSDFYQIVCSALVGAAEGAFLVLFPGSSMLICALSGAIDTAVYEAIDGSSWQTILINSAFSAFLGAAAGADSLDFVRTKKVLIQAVDAKKAINKGIHPKTKEIFKTTNKNISKARKYILKSSLRSLPDDIMYELLNFISSEYVSMI